MLMLFHPTTWKINDTANLIPPSVSLSPRSVNEFKAAQELSKTLHFPPSSSLANQRIASLIFIAEVPLGENKTPLSFLLSLPLCLPAH